MGKSGDLCTDSMGSFTMGDFNSKAFTNLLAVCLYYRQASSLCCSLKFLKCYGYFWVGGLTFHL